MHCTLRINEKAPLCPGHPTGIRRHSNNNNNNNTVLFCQKVLSAFGKTTLPPHCPPPPHTHTTYPPFAYCAHTPSSPFLRHTPHLPAPFFSLSWCHGNRNISHRVPLRQDTRTWREEEIGGTGSVRLFWEEECTVHFLLALSLRATRNTPCQPLWCTSTLPALPFALSPFAANHACRGNSPPATIALRFALSSLCLAITHTSPYKKKHKQNTNTSTDSAEGRQPAPRFLPSPQARCNSFCRAASEKRDCVGNYLSCSSAASTATLYFPQAQPRSLCCFALTYPPFPP